MAILGKHVFKTVGEQRKWSTPPVCYLSYKYKSDQKCYAIVEKEALEIVLAIEKIIDYLTRLVNSVEILTNQNPVMLMENGKHKNMRELWQAPIMQHKNLANIIADTLTRP